MPRLTKKKMHSSRKMSRICYERANNRPAYDRVAKAQLTIRWAVKSSIAAVIGERVFKLILLRGVFGKVKAVIDTYNHLGKNLKCWLFV